MIAIRVDSNDVIAMGHIMRCLSIAEHMTNKPLFICSEEKTKELVESKGYRGISLNNNFDKKDDEIDNLIDVIISENIKTMLIDSYYVTKNYFERLHKKVRIVYIDDINTFKYDVDVIINYTYNINSNIYDKWGYSNTKLVLGSKYAPLRSQFENESITIKDVERIFLTTGGTDNYHMVMGILERLISQGDIDNREVNVVIGRYYKDYNKLIDYVKNKPNIHIYKNISNMVNVMKECDIAISAGGVTLTELATLGIPTICFAIADNQHSGTTAYDNDGLMINAGDVRENRERVIENIATYVSYLANRLDVRTSMSNKMKANFDGCGARRIAKILENESFLNNKEAKLVLAKEEDCKLIYTWANDQSVRENSFKPKRIVYDEHKEWFKNKLNDENCSIYILVLDDNKVGQIRIEIDKSIATISYSIAKEHRAKGYGKLILTLLEEKLRNKSILIIRGLVKYENIVSIKCFESCGYTKVEKENYLVFEKKINNDMYWY